MDIKYLKKYYYRHNFLGPLDGDWSVWGSWSPCSQSCRNRLTEGGVRIRKRQCNNPPATDGGLDCLEKQSMKNIKKYLKSVPYK